MNVSPSPDPATLLQRQQASPVPSIEGGTPQPQDEADQSDSASRAITNGGDVHADSEAETEIDSPVKKKEAEKQQQQQQQQHHAVVAKPEKSQKSRIGSLPVPHDDDDDAESGTSPVDSTDTSLQETAREHDVPKNEDDTEMLDRQDSENDSDDLSSPQSDDNDSDPPSRAASERPQNGDNERDGSPNPRKRKHRASSVSLPNSKRQSMDPPKRTRLRNMYSEGNVNDDSVDRSLSPRARMHRRAVSTQSALDSVAVAGRKRRSIPTLSGHDINKPARMWEESDASSETTSRGQYEESKRPQRGSSRWASATPARVGGREHKRHVNKYGFTRLAEACEDGNLDLVKEWRDKDPDQLELAEFAGNTPLQIAALNGNDEVVSYLIEQGCKIGCANVDKDTPLIDAAENGHLGVVKLLLDAGVDPLRQNIKGQQALDVVTDDTDEATGIRAALHAAIDRWNSSEAKQQREVEEEQRHRAGPSKELHLMARTYENLLKLVQNNDRTGVREFLDARVPVDNAVIAAAAKTGDLYLVNMLLVEMTAKKASQRPQKPVLAVLGTGHFEMVQALTQLDHFDPLWRNTQGKSLAEVAEDRAGPMWKQEKELLLGLAELRMAKGGNPRRSSSPVAKRDGPRRRALPMDDEESSSSSDEDQMLTEATETTTTWKNGRRLLRRRAMRGKGALSDTSEEEDEMEAGKMLTLPRDGDAEVMKPPDSPSTARRLRSKSVSSPAQGTSSTSERMLRRRSSSLRGPQDLPALKEEEIGEVNDESRNSHPSPRDEAQVKQNREAEVKFHLQEAKRLEDKRVEAEATAAEAKRAEEEARRLEEEKREEEVRQAEELRKHQEAELARQAEEERVKRVKEEAQRRDAYCADVYDALPSPIRYQLQEGSLQSEHVSCLRQLGSPLHVLSDVQDGDLSDSAWVLNLEVAPLLASSGVEVFFKPARPGYEGSRAERWASASLQPQDWRLVDSLLAQNPSHYLHMTSGFMGSHAEDSMDDELRYAVERYDAFRTERAKLLDDDGPVALRRLRLDDVMLELSSSQRDVSLELAPGTSSGAITDPTLGSPARKDSSGEQQDFVDCLSKLRKSQAERLRSLGAVPEFNPMEGASPQSDSCIQWTDVVVVHAK